MTKKRTDCQLPDSKDQPGFCPNPSKHEIKLFRKLNEIQVKCKMKYWDGKNGAYLVIPSVRLNIRISESQQSFSFSQWNKKTQTDLVRSKDEYITLYISNEEIKHKISDVTEWISRIVQLRSDS